MEKHNVLVVGGGGREHAIVWKLSQSKKVGKIYCVPGNGGIASLAECHSDIAANDINGIIEFVKAHPDIYMCVVAPDEPLALGLVDELEKIGCKAFGASAAAAHIEASKVFAKQFMKRHNIPSASYETFSSFSEAVQFVKGAAHPLVIKADGLALGKGAVICENVQESICTLEQMMCQNKFGKAGKSVVIEEFLTGFEVSMLAFTDGKSVVAMPSSQDHKRAYDGDKGLNTGGMGSFSPSKRFSLELEKKAYDQIMLPTIRGLSEEGREFRGVIYFGLMVTSKGEIKVIEYNARFGDPETQSILPRLNTDLFDIFTSVIEQRLDKIEISYSSNACVCVILASKGYPEKYEKGKKISIGELDKEIMLFHAGTEQRGASLYTSGGRVIGVCAMGEDIDKARARVYANIDKVAFEDSFYRKDIGGGV